MESLLVGHDELPWRQFLENTNAKLANYSSFNMLKDKYLRMLRPCNFNPEKILVSLCADLLQLKYLHRSKENKLAALWISDYIMMLEVRSTCYGGKRAFSAIFANPVLMDYFDQEAKAQQCANLI